MAHLRFRPDPEWDVLVAGGGPAGAAVAARLARAGQRVLLLDRQRFPRDKVCGDFVGPAALVELEALGVTGQPEYRRTNLIHQAALYLDGLELIRRHMPEADGLPPYGRVIPRLQLDAWVLEAARRAGAHLLEGARVTGYEVDPHGVTVFAEAKKAALTYRARVLIGADGSNSMVSRVLRGGMPPDEDRIIAVRGYYVGDSGPDDRCDLYFSAESFPGYYWVFPTGRGEANVGVGMVLETLPRTSDHLRELLLDLVEKDPSLNARLRDARLQGKVVGWPLTTYDPRLPVSGERVLLVGDAAGFINPLNGEGIQYALTSAHWAAETVLAARREGDFSAERLAPYAARAERELRCDMALAGLIVQLIRNRRLTPVWLEALRVITSRARVDPQYAEITGGILAGLTPAREALTPKVVGRTIDQAAYSLGLSIGWNLLRGPKNFASWGLGAALEGSRLAGETLLHPLELVDWITGVVRHGTEFTSQFGSRLVDRSPSPAQITPQPGPVRLKIPLDHVHHDLLDEPTVV